MLQSRIADTEFHISLDDMDLDLNFLKHYIQRTPDETRQLWSKSFMDKGSEFNHVAIVSEKIEDEDYCLELYETYRCYICNIEVPQTCYKNHNKSRKHQIYKKLTEKVLENVTKQIKVDVDNIHNKVEDTSYYCETCSKLVSVKDQRKHYLSSYHLKSIENEKLVANFFEMYTDGMKIVNNNTKKDLNETVSEYYSVYNTDGSGDDDEEFELEKCYNTTSIALKNSTHTLHEDSILISSTKSEESVDASPIKMPNFELYLKEMIAKYKLNFNIPTIENNCVLISTPKGYKEKVTVDTFHGYKKIDSFLFCLLCSRWLDEKTEKQQHNATEQHVRNIIRPVNDNFERVMDHQYSHCLLCNDRIVTESDHADVTLVHKKYQQPPASASKDLKYDKLLDNLTTPTLKTAKETPSSKENVEYTTSKTSKAAPLSFENIDVVTIGRKLFEYKKHLSYLTPTVMNCLICAVNVPKTTSNIITHVEGHLHTTACENLLQKNKVEKISFGLYHCRVCNDYTKNFMTHIKTHNKKKPSVGRDIIEKQEFRKYVYEDPMNNSPIAVRYRQIHKESLERNKIISRGESTFYCKVCLIKLTRISEIDHMFGERHKFNLDLKSS